MKMMKMIYAGRQKSIGKRGKRKRRERLKGEQGLLLWINLWQSQLALRRFELNKGIRKDDKALC